MDYFTLIINQIHLHVYVIFALQENSEPPAKKQAKEDFLTKIADIRTSVCASVAEFKFNKKRVRVLTKCKDFAEDSNGVVYWMSRDQRVQGMLVCLALRLVIHCNSDFIYLLSDS